MKSKLFSAAAVFALIIAALTGVFCFLSQNTNTDEQRSENLVALNEIIQLAEEGENLQITEKAQLLRESIRNSEQTAVSNNSVLIFGGIMLTVVCIIFLYIYFTIFRPFEKMKKFAEEIASGNFDIPLEYERSNYFGKFTWAFDSMRREITKARASEKEAIENNKTVIATLSHDIKTPIASIRAYAEGLEASLDTSPEKRQRYLSTIMKKCDEVSRLTNDLFLHSLSDLDKLKINSEELELCSFMETVVNEIAAEQNDINFTAPDFSAVVYADRNRLTQIAENLINNARKYAKSEIDISLTRDDDYVSISFQDYGGGIPDKDMPFIFDKFYRGKNCGDEQGSGLGLYIVKYLSEKMNGKVLLHNRKGGLEAVISLPIKTS
ncbi:MAG: HAMP domain-containing histidine kinase [Ruminococcus sp.]|jgi:signal transduction histidine kinase|nr:HAMP domain-containing histidine kinase [Ruminococcus sp.]